MYQLLIICTYIVVVCLIFFFFFIIIAEYFHPDSETKDTMFTQKSPFYSYIAGKKKKKKNSGVLPGTNLHKRSSLVQSLRLTILACWAELFISFILVIFSLHNFFSFFVTHSETSVWRTLKVYDLKKKLAPLPDITLYFYIYSLWVNEKVNRKWK